MTPCSASSLVGVRIRLALRVEFVRRLASCRLTALPAEPSLSGSCSGARRCGIWSSHTRHMHGFSATISGPRLENRDEMGCDVAVKMGRLEIRVAWHGKTGQERTGQAPKKAPPADRQPGCSAVQLLVQQFCRLLANELLLLALFPN